MCYAQKGQNRETKKNVSWRKEGSDTVSFAPNEKYLVHALELSKFFAQALTIHVGITMPLPQVNDLIFQFRYGVVIVQVTFL